MPVVQRLAVDEEYLRRVVVELASIPSPTGRTDHAVQYVGERLAQLGVPFGITRRGAVSARLGDHRVAAGRAVTCHVDTIGLMVKSLKDNGRLEVTPIGTHSARFSEGATVRVFVDDLDHLYSGTVLPLKASGHRYDSQVDTQGVGWDHVEVRVDARVHDRAGLAALGIRVGDHLAMEAGPRITPTGFVRSRHLDDKAGVAAVLAAVKAVVESGLSLPVETHLLVTTTEEVGSGASSGLDDDVAEMVSVDNGVVAPGQESREDAVNIAFADSSGPFDYHLTRRLVGLARAHGIAHTRDVFDFYRSDLAAAVEAGAETRTALLGIGVDASHGHERTHLDGMRATAELLAVYLQTPLVFDRWDTSRVGRLADFPSLAVQPADDAGPREGPIGVDGDEER